MKYFKNVNTLEELRKQYKELLKVHHPDNGGNVAQMQEVNAEYDSLFKQLKDRRNSNTTDNTDNNGKPNYYANMYNRENNRALRGVLYRILRFYPEFKNASSITG